MEDTKFSNRKYRYLHSIISTLRLNINTKILSYICSCFLLSDTKPIEVEMYHSTLTLNPDVALQHLC